MRSLHIVIDERAAAALDRFAEFSGRAVEDLAAAAVEDAALRADPGPRTAEWPADHYGALIARLARP